MGDKRDGWSVQVLKAPVNLFPKLSDEMGRVFQWLRDHDLKRVGKGQQFIGMSGGDATIGNIAQLAIKELKLASPLPVVRSWVQDARRAAPDLLAGTAVADSAKPPAFDLTFEVVPGTVHVGLKDGQVTTDDPQGQLTAQADISVDCDDPAFPKLSWQVQLARSERDFSIQGINGSLNATWSKSFLEDALKLEVVANVLAGLAPGSAPPGVSVPMVPQGQVGVSGEVSYVLPGTGKHVSFVFKMAASVTATQGSQATADVLPQALVKISF